MCLDLINKKSENMKVVILGAGEVGFHVAKALSEEDYDITVIDIDPDKCQRAKENLDVIVVTGNGASPSVLLEAKVSNADYVLCLTRVDEINLIAAQQAHELGANKIIARLRNQDYTAKDSIIRPEKFGVDYVIHPEKEVCNEIARLVRHPYAVQAVDFEGGRLKMLGIKISDKNINLMGNNLSEICISTSHFRFGVIAILRDKETVIPSGEFNFKSGDIAYFIIKSDDLDHLLTFLSMDDFRASRVMIVGASKIGRTLAKKLPSEDFNVRLVDYNRPKASLIANDINQAMVIHGDGTDIEFLKSENIQDVDSFIAVTEDDKTNLISGLLANHLGAKQIIIHVQTTEFIPTIQEVGVGAVSSKNLSTVNSILKHLHSDLSQIPIMTFDELDLEAIEFQPDVGSPVTQKLIKELDLPEDSIVGMINHHGKIRIAHGDLQLTDDDTALVFAKPHAIKKLKKLFNK